MQTQWHTFWRSAAWEWRAIKRSGLERVTLIWLPIIAIGSIWFIFSTSQVHNLPIGVLDKSHSSLSRKLINTLDASPSIAIRAHYRDAQEMKSDLQKHRVYAVVTIPQDFSRRIQQMHPSPVTLVVNAQFGTHSGIIQSGVSAAVRTFSAGIELHERESMGLSHQQALVSAAPIKVSTKMAFNLSLNYQQYLASTIIPALLHILAAVAGAGMAGRELLNKSLQTWFTGMTGRNSSHFSPFWRMFAVLQGKVFWYAVIFCFWMCLTLCLITWGKPVQLSNLIMSMVSACLFMLLSLWLGMFLTMLTMSKRMGLSSTGIITAPAFAFSGITYPLVSMPEMAQNISMALPLTHYEQLQVAQLQAQQVWQFGLPVVYGFAITIIILIAISTKLTLRALTQKHRWGRR